MRRRLAALRTWGTGSVWIAGSDPEPAPAQVTVVHVVHHYLPDGQLPGPPQQRDAITSAERHREAVNP